jgi:hypothetical protein
MVHAVQVRTISNDEGNRLLRIVRRGTGSVVTWRRAQMVLLREPSSGQPTPERSRRDGFRETSVRTRPDPARYRTRGPSCWAPGRTGAPSPPASPSPSAPARRRGTAAS